MSSPIDYGQITYMMAKPYCAPHLALLEDVLTASGLGIQSLYKVADWKATSSSIYKPQLDENLEFKAGFEEHVWLINQFWGNRAMTLLLGSDSASCMDELVKQVYSAKMQFRGLLPGGEKGDSCLMFVNLDTVPTLEKRYGSKGNVGVQDSGSFAQMSAPGTWDFLYFKFAHCPDSQAANEYELGVLKELGILSPANEVSLPDWEIMKKLGTLVPPSEVIGKSG